MIEALIFIVIACVILFAMSFAIITGILAYDIYTYLKRYYGGVTDEEE